MITIDLVNNISTLYATLNENSLTTDPVYKLKLFNSFTNVTYNYEVTGTTYSNQRIDRVTIALNQEVDDKVLDTGQYEYTFYEVQDDDSLVIVEQGLCKVGDSSDVETYYDLETDETDDDYIAYKN